MIKKNKSDLTEIEYLVTQEDGTDLLFKMSIGIILKKGFMLIKFLVNLYLLQKKNLNQTVVGLVSQKL